MRLNTKTAANRPYASIGWAKMHLKELTTLHIQQICNKMLITEFKAKAGFPKMRLHDLRHTVVTSGLSPKTVQEYVGHTDARFTLKQYAHVVNEQA